MLTNKLARFSYGDFSVVSKKVAAVLPLSTGTACTHTTHRGRKCIAHSRPHSLKQVVYANWHRDDALLF